ncbi:hypothetical protein [Bradyrhizobium sp. th.b2]|uniref:hypothetical protein n=1 Tax=Bradyrhizobium sp. th-b2 TaxID=172088 RepID=UPI000490E74F|nr:hypothetical protein [Bradyrhizobium sp. th.b2]
MFDNLADARDALNEIATDTKLDKKYREKFTKVADALGKAEGRIGALEQVVKALTKKTGLTLQEVGDDPLSRVPLRSYIKDLVVGS